MAPSKSPPIPIDSAPITLLMWSKWSAKPRWKKWIDWCMRNKNDRFTSWLNQKRTQHGCLTGNIRDVRIVPARNEIAVEIHHDHPSVLFLKQNKRKKKTENGMCRKAVKKLKINTNLRIHKFRHKHPLFLSFTFNIWSCMLVLSRTPRNHLLAVNSQHAA